MVDTYEVSGATDPSGANGVYNIQFEGFYSNGTYFLANIEAGMWVIMDELENIYFFRENEDPVGLYTNELGSGTVYVSVPGGTGTNFQINVGDAWKSVTDIKVNVGDSWKTVTAASVNVGDTWKTIF